MVIGLILSNINRSDVEIKQLYYRIIRVITCFKV
jgi:hypothetical protein